MSATPSALRQRTRLLERAFLHGRTPLLGHSLRPVTLLSLELCHRSGLPLIGGLESFQSHAPDVQAQLIARFIWLHTQPWDIVLDHVQAESLPPFEVPPAASVIAAFTDWLVEFNEMVSAAAFIPRLRQGYERESPPADLAPTCWLSDMVDEIAARYHWAEEYILKVLPFVRAVQYHHHAMAARQHLWTTVPGKATATQVQDLTALAASLAALQGENDNEV